MLLNLVFNSSHDKAVSFKFGVIIDEEVVLELLLFENILSNKFKFKEVLQVCLFSLVELIVNEVTNDVVIVSIRIFFIAQIMISF